MKQWVLELFLKMPTNVVVLYRLQYRYTLLSVRNMFILAFGYLQTEILADTCVDIGVKHAYSPNVSHLVGINATCKRSSSDNKNCRCIMKIIIIIVIIIIIITL